MSEVEREIVMWQKNFFRRTMNIYEPRGPKYHCTQCNEMLNTRLSIFTHSKIHLKPFCIVCGLYTQNQDEMQNHMKNAHRGLVDIQKLSKVKDENQNKTKNLNEHQKDSISPHLHLSAPAKKSKGQPVKMASYGYNGQPKSDRQHLVSRFGRCINVKIPADF